MPVDAYPDLSPPMGEIITQWPGHRPRNRAVGTLPIEVEMNGAPHMVVMRSISLYGLSDVKMTFQESTDDYFARQVVFHGCGRATAFSVTAGLSPTIQSSGPGVPLRLESPDRSPQELKTIEIGRRESLQSVPGVADDSGFGGTTMQYQVLLDPTRIYSYHVSVRKCWQRWRQTTQMQAADLLARFAVFYVRGLVW